MEMKRGNANSTLGLFVLLGIVQYSSAFGGGIIGDAFKNFGKAVGSKQIAALGQALDNGNRDLKNLLTPYGQLEDAGSGVVLRGVLGLCEAAFDGLTQPVVANCSNSSGRMDHRAEIQNAETTLQKLGFFTAQSFAGIDIRVCNTPMAEGLTPDATRVYLRPDAFENGPVWVGELLAHEMTHVRQYSRMGSGEFKCGYSQAFIRCFGCQNEHNDFEREALDVQAQAEMALIRYYGAAATPSAELQAQSVDEDFARSGYVTISNATPVAVQFDLESQNRGRTTLTLGPYQFQTYLADAQDSGFNIRIGTNLDNAGRITNVRTYGIAAGGIYYITGTPAGIFDIAVNDGSSLRSPDLQDSTSTILGLQYAETSNGILVEEVSRGSLAAHQWMRPGDIILKIRDTAPSASTLDDLLEESEGKLVRIYGIREQSPILWTVRIPRTTPPPDEATTSEAVITRVESAPAPAPRTLSTGECETYKDGSQVCRRN
jgi:hypothetical protein